MIEYKVISDDSFNGTADDRRKLSSDLTELAADGWKVLSFQATPSYAQRGLVDKDDMSFNQFLTILLEREIYQGQ